MPRSRSRWESGLAIAMESAGLSTSSFRQLVFLAACFGAVLAGGATTVRYCDQVADYAIKVKAVDIFPNPVIRGKPAKFSIAAVAGKAISDGQVVIDVKYFGIHVHQETHPLCTESHCPVSKGDFLLSHDQTLPAFTPPGSYTLTMKILGDDGVQLTCISFDFKIKIDSPLANN